MSTFKQKMEAQRKAIADRNASFERAYKFKVGKTHIRIMPGVKVPENFDRKYGAHYIKHPVTQAMIAVVGDAEICYEKPCPIREGIGEVMSQAQSRGDDALAKAAKSWLAKEVYVVNAQIVGGVDEENKGKVVRIEFSSNGFDSIASIMLDLDEQIDGFDIKNGAIITVERTGTGQTDTRYTYTPHLKQPTTPASEAIMAQRIDLDTYFDGKFGASVAKAQTALSNILGRDVSEGALSASRAAAITDRSAYDEDGISSKAATPEATDAEFDDLLDGDEIPPFDTPEETKPAETKAATKASAKKTEAAAPKADEFEDILADLDNL